MPRWPARGSSGAVVRHVLADVERGAQREAHVVQRGEPGVGLVRGQLHASAARRAGLPSTIGRRGRSFASISSGSCRERRPAGEVGVLRGEVGQQPGEHAVVRAGRRPGLHAGEHRELVGRVVGSRLAEHLAHLVEQPAQHRGLLRVERADEPRLRRRAPTSSSRSRTVMPCCIVAHSPAACSLRHVGLDLSLSPPTRRPCPCGARRASARWPSARGSRRASAARR